MKRSRSISLALIASVSAVALAGCDDTPDTQVMGEFFTNKEQCVAEYDEATCDKAMADAQAEFAKTAPKFASREECEKEFGPEACGPAPQTQQTAQPDQNGNTTIINNGGGQQSSSGFMPFMLGYMLGNASSPPTPVFYGPGSYRERDRDRRVIYTGGGGSTRPIGYVAPNALSVNGRNGGSVPRSVIVSPSRSTGGIPTPSSIGSSLRSSTALSSTRIGSGASIGSSFGGGSARVGTSIGGSSRGGFGSVGRSFGGISA